MASLLPYSTVSILYKCYVRPLLEYAIPLWLFSLSSRESAVLDRLQATAARAYIRSKAKVKPNWDTSKEYLNSSCSWESLAWRRHILSLVFFQHIFYQYPSLLVQFNIRRASFSNRHPLSLILPKCGSHFSRSPLFNLPVVLPR